jgi:hypothetical protein
MVEPLLQRTREEVVVILQQGGERGAVRRAVYLQVTDALGRVEVAGVGVEQIAYTAMRGAFQAAEQTGRPIEIVAEDASAGILDAVKDKGGQAAEYLRAAIQGATTAVEEYAARLREIASEVAEKTRQGLQALIDRLRTS